MKKLLLLAGSLLTACHQQADPTPSGTNTFYCQIDGQDFTPHLPTVLFIGPIKALDAGRFNRKGGLTIEAETSFDELSILLLDAHAPGTYQLGKGTPYWKPGGSYATYTSNPALPANGVPLPSIHYYTDSAAVGTITLTRYDTLAHVAGGTFSYTAREKATGKLVHITNGRFDVTF